MSSELIQESIFSVDTVPPPAGEMDAYSAQTTLNPPSLALIALLAKDHAACDELEKRVAPAAPAVAPLRTPKMLRVAPRSVVIPTPSLTPPLALAPVRSKRFEMWLAVAALATFVTAACLTSFLA